MNGHTLGINPENKTSISRFLSSWCSVNYGRVLCVVFWHIVCRLSKNHTRISHNCPEPRETNWRIFTLRDFLNERRQKVFQKFATRIISVKFHAESRNLIFWRKKPSRSLGFFLGLIFSRTHRKIATPTRVPVGKKKI